MNRPLLKKDITVLGYSAIDYNGDDRSYESTKQYHESLDAVSTFSYLIDDQGNLIGNAPIDELEFHRQKGINPLALIHNFTQDAFNTEYFLKNIDIKEKLLYYCIKALIQ